MNLRLPCNRIFPRLAGMVTALAMFGGTAQADSLWASSARGDAARSNALEIAKIRITRIDDAAVTFANPAGRESERPLEQVVRIAIDDEPALNSAEEAFIADNWEPAVEGYLKTLRTTRRDWLKGYVAGRLLTAAEKGKRFDAAAAAYVAAVVAGGEKLPAKPSLPDAGSTYLATAVKDVEAALQNAKLSSSQQQALLSFLLDLHRARDDQKAMADVLEQMVKAGAVAANDPAAAGALARMKLDVAAIAVEQKQYQKAIDTINASRTAFTAPADQAQALFLLAQAQEGLAGDDSTAVQDAALAYMRVVAHAKDTPDAQPLVVRSLMQAASILERINQPQAAAELYEQIAAQYPDAPAAAPAREHAPRLRQQTPATAPAVNPAGRE